MPWKISKTGSTKEGKDYAKAQSITHQAIASARQAQVLDLLLNSVYSEKTQLSLDNLQAPQVGNAAL